MIFSGSKNCLEKLIPLIAEFLEQKLKLILHPNKIYIKTLSSGVDFLGWVHFFDHRVLRTVTKNRMLKKLKGNDKIGTLNSYLGLLKHGNTNKLLASLDL